MDPAGPVVADHLPEGASMAREGTRNDIDVNYLQEQLQALLDIPSPTGFTDNIVRHVCHELDRLGVAYELTRRGAIRARLPGIRRGRAPSSRTSTRWGRR